MERWALILSSCPRWCSLYNSSRNQAFGFWVLCLRPSSARPLMHLNSLFSPDVGEIRVKRLDDAAHLHNMQHNASLIHCCSDCGNVLQPALQIQTRSPPEQTALNHINTGKYSPFCVKWGRPRGSVRRPDNFLLPSQQTDRGCHSLGCKYGCWAAARGESAWITGGWTGPVLLAASLDVQDHSYTGYQAADTVDTDRCFSSRTLARARPDGFPRRTAASAAMKSNFSVSGSDWAGSVRTRQLFCWASPRWCRCPRCGVRVCWLAQPPSDSTHRRDWTKGLGSGASWGYDERQRQSGSSTWRTPFKIMGIYTARCSSVKIRDSQTMTQWHSLSVALLFDSAQIK